MLSSHPARPLPLILLSTHTMNMYVYEFTVCSSYEINA